MRRHDRACRGFTLVELMITVAIIGILASIAIPNFVAHQLRTKRSESYANLSAIATTETAYFSEYGVYVNTAPMPGPAPTSQKRVWTAAAEAAFGPLGWTPEGNVYFDYDVNTAVTGGCPCTVCYTASGYGELDGDGNISNVLWAHADANGNVCPAAVTGDPPVDSGGVTVLDAPLVSPLSDDF